MAVSGLCALWYAARFISLEHTSVGGGPPYARFGLAAPTSASAAEGLCPQVDATYPLKHADLDGTLMALYADETFQARAFEALAGAIQIPTESYDDLKPVGKDPRWETFGVLQEYLQITFPKVFQTLSFTTVNTYGIVLHWQGSDTSTRPVLMAGHQDVVPVEPTTVNDWKHPPYSGLFDGEWIWGRGTCDDKSDVIASLHAIDALIEQGFQPRRTFVWAYGFDEEASGMEGAGKLAEYLEETYGTHGFEMLLDEGGSYGTPYGEGVIFATPALSEKGYLDVRVEVTTKGGHSSVPPAHTGIGMLSAMIVELEANPLETSLIRGGSPYNYTMCAAAHGPAYPPTVRRLALHAAETGSDADLADLEDALLAAFPFYSAVLRTTQAVDLVAGGVKVNALPERVSAVVNHRIAEHASVAALQAHYVATLAAVAEAFDLTLDAFGTNVSAGTGRGGHVALSDAWGTALEPSPVTPMGKGAPYEVFAGTVKATIESSDRYEGSSVVVAPLLTIGNTDTRYYWNLTKHIVRYKHLHNQDAYNGAHTVNEAVRAKGWIETIRFYTKFVLNWDEHQ
ncbi:carboxypeptidase S [Epithele typhae]|uniref:carboxypeptidase S n=1 Tax=Epithele typhae TaxID=378194 RepID=UPI002007415B|nr:carboxypeptidase S [Epithele typhae]KAH9935922.1 carboxypeptidase S [Epithele typhae]